MLTLFEHVRDWWYARRTSQITPDRVRERVQRGAEYLDQVDAGWYRRVDAQTLELGDGRQCILGQLHGEFRLGLGRSHLVSMSSAPRTSLSPVSYGFKCVDGVSDEWQDRDYELLTTAWKEAVRDRQDADAGSDGNEAAPHTGDSLPAEAVELGPSETPAA